MRIESYQEYRTRCARRERRTEAPAELSALEARAHTNELLLIGVRQQQAELAERQQEDRDGTTARRRLEHQRDLIRLGDPALSEPDAMALAIRRDPELYAEYGARVTVTSAGHRLAVGATPVRVEPVKAVSPRGTTAPAARAEIERRIAEEIGRTGVGWSEALDRVLKADPALYQSYRDQQVQAINGVDVQDAFRQNDRGNS